MHKMRILRRTLIGSVSALAFAAAAAAQTKTIDIPAEDLKSALDAYIRQAGVQLVYKAADISGLQSHAVHGAFAPADGLNALLQGSGVSMHRDPSGAFVVSKSAEKRAEADPPVEAAQTAEAGTETVTVTGSRLISNGSQAPTPTTVVSDDLVKSMAQVTIADALIQQPQLRGSNAPSNNGINTLNSGRNFLNLRSLGPNRGLILLDGRRVVQTGSTGDVDINVIPQSLISRTEIVTGGASAAYGSDAVAGVVNFIVNTNYDGFKGEMGYGISDRADDQVFKVSLAAGGSFGDGRGHIVFGAEYERVQGITNPGFGLNSSRPWTNSAVVQIANPAVTATNPASVTNPKFILINNARLSVDNQFGVVQSGPLKNMQFTANGSLIPFNPGSPVSGSLASGGDGYNWSPGVPLVNPYGRANLFTHMNYDLSDNVTFFSEVWVSQNESFTSTLPLYMQTVFTSGFPLSINNPYLSASTVAAMQNANVTSLNVLETVSGGGTIPSRVVSTQDYTGQATLGLEGKFGSGWTWSLYGEYGRNQDWIGHSGNLNLANFLNATNAVRNSSGNIVCSVTVTNPNSGCVPVDFIGNNPINAAQQKYLFGTSQLQAISHMDVLNAEVKGSPFSTWAGPVAVDVGVDTRQEGINQTSDPISTAVNPLNGTNTGGWIFTNPQPLKGSFRLWEVYGEAFVPLADGLPLAYHLDFDGAVRHTDYSTSGGVTTWKAGLSYAPFDDQLRLRVTQSADIRAPNIAELFKSSSQSLGNAQDPFLGNQSFQFVTQSTGNASLKPETANTTTLGVVYAPEWIPGLVTSIDGYNIHIKGAISSQTPQVMVNECFAGNTAICAFITRDPTSNKITSFTLPLLNLNDLETAGLDFEGDYNTPLSTFVEDWEGNLLIRFNANYVNKYSTTSPGSAPLNAVGGLGGGGGQTLPRWLGNLNISYSNGPWTFSGQTRWIGGVKYDVTLGPAQLAHNYVSDRFYQDISASYKMDLGGVKTELYGVVQQLFDSDPPLVPAAFAGSATNPSLYDQIGRAYRFGLRFAL